MELIRLRIEIDSVDVEFTRSLGTNRFWYMLDKGQLGSIETFRRHLVSRICCIMAIGGIRSRIKLPRHDCVKLSMDGFELPNQESTNLLRNRDKVVIHFIDRNQSNDFSNSNVKENNNHKRKQLDDLTDIAVPAKKTLASDVLLDNNSLTTTTVPNNYTACLIGTSMVKHLSIKELFPDRKCFFKSISGGSIKNVLQCLRARSNCLGDCQVFVITAGSNNIDREAPVGTDTLKSSIEHFLTLCTYLKETYPSARFVINKLIPRTKTKYIDLHVFEQRRVEFNEFLVRDLTFLGDLKVVSHPEFERKQELCNLLIDGVHISPVRGVPLYTAAIKKFL